MYVSFEKSARKATGMIANLRHLAKNIDKIFCLSAYLLVLSIGCNKVERPFSKVLEPECRIQVDLKESNSFEFDDFFSGIEVVPLETSRDAILGNPKKMLVRKGCYYIHNAQQNCVTGFDADGKLEKTGRMHNKSFQRKRWGYSGEPVVTKCRLVVKCLRLPKDVKGGD